MALKRGTLTLLFIFSVSVLCGQGVSATVKVINRTQNRSFETQYRTLERDLTRMISQQNWRGQQAVSASDDVSVHFTLSVIEHRNQVFKTMLMVELVKKHKNLPALLLRWVEQPLEFSYVPFQPLVYNPNMLHSNLVANAAFFTYLALGFYHDSERMLGGTSFYREAEAIITRMQSSSHSGWEMRRNGNSKYRLISELLQKQYEPLRVFIFKLHSDCLAANSHTGQMAKNNPCITEAVSSLRTIQKDLNNSLLLQRIEESNKSIF